MELNKTIKRNIKEDLKRRQFYDKFNTKYLNKKITNVNSEDFPEINANKIEKAIKKQK